MSAAMCGFLYPGPSRPTFVIPFFGAPDSTARFVQELDEQHCIGSFLRFDPSIFETYAGTIPVMEVGVGGDGVIGFVDGKGKLHSGTAAEIRSLLANYSFADDGSDAFFATEVMEFRGDSAGLARAIDVAAHRFGDPAHGMRWRAREISIRRRTSEVPDPEVDRLAAALRELRQAQSRDWIGEFSKAWRQFGPQGALFEAAIEWLQDGNSQRYEAGKLFGFLLLRKRRQNVLEQICLPSQPSIARLALRWLEELQHPGMHWAIVWQRLWDGRHFPEADLISVAYHYLHTEDHVFASNGRTGPRDGWVRMWRAMWIEGHQSERHALISLFEQRREHLMRLPDLGGVMLLVSEDPDHRPWALVQIEEWLMTSSHRSRHWMMVLSKVLNRFPDHQFFPTIALEWLHGDGARFSGWYEVWSILRRKSVPHSLDAVAYEWLLQGRVTMRIWPDVLADFLDNGRLDLKQRLRELAEQWLQLGKPHEHRERIEAFVRDLTRQSGEILRRKIYISISHDIDSWRAAQVRTALGNHETFAEVPHLDKLSWDALRHEGPSAIETFIDNQLLSASAILILYGAETDLHAEIDFEILRSHELGLGIIAIDMHRLPDLNGQLGLPAPNPLEAWQVEAGDELMPLSKLYSSYDWVVDDGAANLANWIDKAASAAADRKLTSDSTPLSEHA
ncbi:hypothetical protein ASE82_08455 [Sphingomonas sp. Leaf230]|uniref:TIR domain-containing protein n=1 Tax=Sphingomonas sp. Leaf230 TaxID=1735694 RepID=UPI0006FB5C40|nr:TIR domain-containing protein [Sphingomonas sp. Leaf230]KQN02380.1 hypothetical protein ASE82_08455 [Sphingomonas sp. Leaf230]